MNCDVTIFFSYFRANTLRSVSCEDRHCAYNGPRANLTSEHQSSGPDAVEVSLASS